MMDSSESVSLLKIFSGLFKRELQLCFRRTGELTNPLLFCLIVVTLFPLGIGPEQSALAPIAAGVVWVIALLACLLSTDMLFKEDLADGSLELFLVSPFPVYILALVKVLVYWLVTGVPLALISPLVGMVVYLPEDGFVTLFLSLLLGTGVMSCLGGVGAALTVSLRRSSVLLTLLILPMYIPVLIFGTMAVERGVNGTDASGYIALLAALLFMAITLTPIAIAAALRVSCDN